MGPSEPSRERAQCLGRALTRIGTHGTQAAAKATPLSRGPPVVLKSGLSRHQTSQRASGGLVLTRLSKAMSHEIV